VLAAGLLAEMRDLRERSEAITRERQSRLGLKQIKAHGRRQRGALVKLMG
jgi:hypothetical protein